ncbi:MAG: PDZ domain-containing protein [Methylotenera sp.]
MPKNIYQLNHQPALQVTAKKPVMTSSFMLLSLLGLAVAFFTSQVHSAENAATQANLYAEKYVAQNGSQLQSLSSSPETQLERRKNQEEDNTRMLENGYDMMGSSTFISTSVADDLALQHGKDLRADTVLVYNKNTPIKTNIVRLDGDKAGEKAADDANKSAVQTPQTIHYATYWAKLPTPLLGVHIIKLIPATSNGVALAEEVKGLTIIAVIKESPAAQARIVKGDNLLKIGEQVLENPDDLFAAVKRYAGQTVPVEVQRGNEVVKTTVALNVRK